MTEKPRSRRILELLETGPKTSAVISGVTGLTRSETKAGISALKRQWMVVTSEGTPGLYEITQKGRYHLDPASDPERKARAAASYQKKLARNRKLRAAIREAARAAAGVVRVAKAPKPPKPVVEPIDEFPVIHRVVPAPKLDEGIVCTAIRCRPALQAVWS